MDSLALELDAQPLGEPCCSRSFVGRYLPSNVALKFSLQFCSVMVFGAMHIIEELKEQRHVLHQLIAKYFAPMEFG